MKKVKTVGTVSEFLNGREKEPFRVKFERHLEKYGMVYKIAGATVIILASGGAFDYAFASSGIEAGAERLYSKLLSIGKWVIIFKGGFDTIKHMAAGNMPEAKQGFIGYLLIYIFLFGLPWAMGEIDGIFKELMQNEVPTIK